MAVTGPFLRIGRRHFVARLALVLALVALAWPATAIAGMTCEPAAACPMMEEALAASCHRAAEIAPDCCRARPWAPPELSSDLASVARPLPAHGGYAGVAPLVKTAAVATTPGPVVPPGRAGVGLYTLNSTFLI